MNRRELVRSLLERRGDALIVTGLGTPTYDVAAAGPHPRNVYLWGTMGGALAVGLGLALARPDDRVVVVTGDGELLMGLHSLATVAASGPWNLAVLVLDNESFAETGNQTGLTASGADLAGMARAAGFLTVEGYEDGGDVRRIAAALFGAPGPVFVCAKVPSGSDGMVIDVIDGAENAARLRAALGVDRRR